jgi:chemotaxis protein MotB
MGLLAALALPLPLTLTLTLTLAAGACGIPQEKYDRAVAQSKALHDRLKECNDGKEALSARVDKLEGELAQVKQAFGNQTANLDKLRALAAKGKRSAAELARIKKRMAEEKALNDRLMGQFKDMISAGQLKVVNVDGRLVIKMASRILFRPGKAKLSRRGRRSLRKLGKILAKVDRHFQVAGHTDNRPATRSKYKDNWELSAIRAVRVVRLLRKVGVPGKNVSAAAFGPYQPASTNRTRIGRRLNRRIEITLLPVIPRRAK